MGRPADGGVVREWHQPPCNQKMYAEGPWGKQRRSWRGPKTHHCSSGLTMLRGRPRGPGRGPSGFGRSCCKSRTPAVVKCGGKLVAYGLPLGRHGQHEVQRSTPPARPPSQTESQARHHPSRRCERRRNMACTVDATQLGEYRAAPGGALFSHLYREVM